MRLRSLAQLLGIAALVACSRTEERRQPELIGTAGSVAPKDAAVAKTPAFPEPAAKPACVVDSSEMPPPEARPAESCPKAPTSIGELERGFVTFLEAPGEPRVSVELADSAAQRERGLMYRTHLADDAGMLFSWQSDAVRSFWMRNTCIPLDMLFITGEAVIAGILEQVPTLNDVPRSIPCPVSHVLELNAGWSRTHGVRAGHKVRIER